MKRYATLLILLIAWVALFVAFSVLIPEGKFARPDNLETIARQTAIVGFAAIGMTFIIIRGAIDLSVGSAVAFVTVVIAWMLQVKGVDGVTAAIVGVLVGGLCGVVNGLLVTALKVSPFIATLSDVLGIIIYFNVAAAFFSL